MKTILGRIYSIYALILFIVTFLLLFPFFLIIILVPSWHKYVGVINRVWAHVYFFLSFMPVEVEVRGELDKKSNYVFCPNHASFFDIPVMGFMSVPYFFVGKSSIEKVPVFGFMYKNLHITVDRSSLKSRHGVFQKSIEALQKGISLVIFPEGGIFSDDPPRMTAFKNGAFKAAIAQQIPIIPVTIPYNWIILPDDGRYLLHWHKAKLIFHEPISTNGLSQKDVWMLKEKVYKIIDDELKQHNSNENK